MIIKSYTRLITGLFFGFILFITCMYIYALYGIEKIKSSPKKFVYETLSGPANPVLFITSRSYEDEYVEYYERVKKDDKNASFNFPLKTFPQNDPVYILSYSEDKRLVKVVSFYNRGKFFGGSYNEGYVLSEFLHETPPPSISK